MKTGRRFGDPSNPLLVSIRSCAKFSMPRMMDTVLNLGLNAETVETLGRISNARFAWDSYRRLIAMFGRIVKDVDGRKFEAILERRKEASHAAKDTELSSDDLKAIVAEFKELYQAEVGEPFPQNGREQLQQAIAAVFRSWNGKRAVDYRNFNKIPHDLGTAANVQTMVFGNMGPDSGTRVAFTRNPSTGEKQLYGEFLSNAQGEDVVAGIRTPLTIGQLRETFPVVYDQFSEAADHLERHYRDIQDIEFTVERGKLWMLQTRTGKRSARAAVKAAVDMAREGLITKQEAILRVEPAHVIQLLLPSSTSARRVGRERKAGSWRGGSTPPPGPPRD